MNRRKICITFLMLGTLLCTSLTGCADTSTPTVTTNTEIGVSDYTEIKWASLPNSMQDECTIDGNKIVLIGYLSSCLSNDGSSCYLYNTHVDLTFKEFSTLDPSSGVKMTSLSLKNKDIDGLQFVKVYGSIIKSKDTDVFGNKRNWHILVDKIEPIDSDSLNVSEYERFAESDEYEALSNAVNYAGSVLYNSSKDGLTNDYEIAKAINGIEENYPEVYKESMDSLNGMLKIVEKVEKDDYSLGDSTEDYNNLVSYYSNFIEVLNQLGLLE